MNMEGGAPAPSGDSGGGASSPSTSSSTPSHSGPSPGAVNVGASADTGGEGADSRESTDGSEPSAAAQAKAVAKYKAKLFGKEREFTPDELSKMVGDDAEYEIPGVGGKPSRMKFSDMVRHAQKGDGYLTKMRELAEERQRIQAEREFGKKDIAAYAEQNLGVEDWRGHVMSEAKRFYSEEQQLNSLIARQVPQRMQDGSVRMVDNPNYNPSEYHQRMAQQAQAKLERKTKLEQSRNEATQREQQTAHQKQQRDNAIGGALREGKIPQNEVTMRIADAIVDQYMQADMKLTAADLVAETKQRYHEMMYGYMDAMDEDSLAGFLGDERRAKIREIELKRAKVQRKEARAADADPAAPNGQQVSKKPLTEAEFNKQFRGRR